MSDTRADTTSMGLYLISFIMLVFGIIGIFGFLSDNMGDSESLAVFLNLFGASTTMMAIAAVLFLVLGYTAWKAGSKFVMIIFLTLSVFSALYWKIAAAATAGPMTIAPGDGLYLIFVAIAIFLIIYALVALVSKSGYMLTLILICAGLVFLFFALGANALTGGSDYSMYMLLLGVFALVAFFFSLWIALADTTDLGLPVM